MNFIEYYKSTFWVKGLVKAHRYTAFTLVEVLIVVGIIGIIAQMTIPQLVADFQVESTVATLKKAYSTLLQAYTTAIQENGTPDNWDLIDIGDETGLENLNKIMTKHLKVQKNCHTGAGCFATKYKDLIKATELYMDAALYTKIVLDDGTSVGFRQWDATCMNNVSDVKNICGVMAVDTNGFKKPNQIGVDEFHFFFTKNTILPTGTGMVAETHLYSFINSCNITKPANAGWLNGSSCTAWVIYNENMDYLKCSDLSWDGKKKCD